MTRPTTGIVRAAAALACALLAAAATAEEKTRDREAWTPLVRKDVSYRGAFTPDGRFFVFPLMPRKGRSALRALEVATGETRDLGSVPVDQSVLAAARGKDPWEPGARPYMAVTAATNSLDTVFLRQELLRGRHASHLAWKPQKKELVSLGPPLEDPFYQGGSPDGGPLVFREGRHPLTLRLYGPEKKAFLPSPDLPGHRDLSYHSLFGWAGGRFYVFSQSRQGPDQGTDVRTAWPEVRLLGRVPPVERTLRKSTGAVQPLLCRPLYCGAPQGRDDVLVFLRGDQVVAVRPETPSRPVPLFTVPVAAEPEPWTLPAAADQMTPRVYGAWCEEPADGPAAGGYGPAEKTLGGARRLALKVVVSSLEPNAASEPVSFDLTGLFDRMRGQALGDYEEDEGPKSDSGVLARTPAALALGAFDGRLLLLLWFRVWYGIRGMDYYCPVLVDTHKPALRSAPSLFAHGSSGERFPPPSFSYRPSPAGTALALIRGTTLHLFRAGG